MIEMYKIIPQNVRRRPLCFAVTLLRTYLILSLYFICSPYRYSLAMFFLFLTFTLEMFYLDPVPTHCNGNSVYIFLFWELRGLSPNFHIHVSVSNLYIPWIGPHISSSRKSRPIEGIYNSLTDTWMWKLGLRPRYSFSGNICFKFSAFCLCSAFVSSLSFYCLSYVINNIFLSFFLSFKALCDLVSLKPRLSLRPETHTLRDRRPSTAVCPAGWTMGIKELKKCTARKKYFVLGAHKSRQGRTIISSDRTSPTNQPRKDPFHLHS